MARRTTAPSASPPPADPAASSAGSAPEVTSPDTSGAPAVGSGAALASLVGDSIVHPTEDETLPDPPGGATTTPAGDGSGGATAPSPGAPPPVQPSPPEAPAPVSVAQRMAELGFADVTDEAAALDRLMAAYRQSELGRRQYEQQFQTLQPVVQAGQQFLDMRSRDPEFDAYLSRARAIAPPAAEPKWWDRPQYDQRLAAHYRERKNVDGQIVEDWKAGTPATIIEQQQKYELWMQEVSHKIVEQPYEAIGEIAEVRLMPLVEQRVQEILAERVDGRERRRELETFADRIERENSDWMYEKDPRTNQVMYVYDPNSGQNLPMVSAQGQQVTEWMNQAAGMGIGDPRQRWEFAMMKRQLAGGTSPSAAPPAAPPPPPTPPPPPAATRADRNAAFVQRQAAAAAPAVNRGMAAGTGAPIVPQKRRVSPGHAFVENLAAAGFSVE
jgi:hypothetical protein